MLYILKAVLNILPLFSSLLLLWRAVLMQSFTVQTYLSSLILFFQQPFLLPNEPSPSNSRTGILFAAACMGCTWNLNFQLCLSSDRFCSLYICWQSAIHRNIQCAFSLLFIYFYGNKKYIKCFAAQRLGLWYKFLYKYKFLCIFPHTTMKQLCLWAYCWGEEAPSKSVEQYLGAGTYLTLLWTEV